MKKLNFDKSEIRKIWELYHKTKIEEKVDMTSDEFLNCKQILSGKIIKFKEKDLSGIIKEIKNILILKNRDKRMKSTHSKKKQC